ncbi:MAG: hypothetical protein QOK49_251 [Baekduia sp.]|jgi:hypothetical protein|nr:hypothetical protein [Baekduia sp.]
MTHPSLRLSAPGQHRFAAQIAAARKVDRHLVAELHGSMIGADRAVGRLGRVERHAVLHLRVSRDDDSPVDRR